MKCKNQGIPGSIDFLPFRLIRPKFAGKAISSPNLKMIQSTAIYNPGLSDTPIGCLRLCRGVERLEVQKSGHSGINVFRPFRLIRPKFACKARSTPEPKMIQSKAMYSLHLSGTLIGCLRLCRGVLQGSMSDNPDIQGSMDSRPFRLILPWFACKSSLTPETKIIQYKAITRLGFRTI